MTFRRWCFVRLTLFSDSEENGARNTIARHIREQRTDLGGHCVVTGGFGIYYRLPRSSRYGFSNINKRSSRSVFRVMERSFHTLLAAVSGGNFDVAITLGATIIPDSDYSTVVFHVNLIKLLSRHSG